MKKNIYLLLTVIFTVSVFTSAQAQRSGGRESGNRDRRTFDVPQRSHSNSNTETRSIHENNNLNRVIPGREDARTNTINNNRNITTNRQGNEIAVRENRTRNSSYGVTQERGYRQNNFERERYGNRSIYNNHNNYNYYRNGYYPRLFMPGPRYSVLPRSFITINFGGYPYYYNGELFYGSYGGHYQPLFPPPGISIRVLPFGYSRILIGVDPFYYFNGIFYRHRDQNDYEVVDAPMGATVSSLPKGAKSMVLNGEKLYELNGTYYKEDRNYKGETVYTVVGKNGEVNNSNSNDTGNIPPPSLNSGNVINELPDGSKVVTINGEKLYVTPDNIYLKEEYDGNIVHYKVVGR